MVHAGLGCILAFEQRATHFGPLRAKQRATHFSAWHAKMSLALEKPL